MKDSKQYHLNEIVFRQGDESVFMYRILRGRVGLFLDYGGSDEVRLAELLENQLFGEMGLLDHAPRSATAVVLEEETELETLTEEDAQSYFEQQVRKSGNGLSTAKVVQSRLHFEQPNKQSFPNAQ